MVGGSRKLGRGGGGNRSIHTPPIKRPSSSSRLSMGGGEYRGRGGASSSSAEAVEESFSLVRENPLNCAMAIKLTPDLVEEIRRVEAQGSNARIKFNGNPNSADGNVISVGDKSFKFTWSQEIPGLCDVYEERRSGEDGNGLLVESGATSRKLSVQRELDESIHNHVKRRSEEAERLSKSRKAICLDPQNSSMKTQAKALAAVESTQRRNFNKKDPHSRKPNSETIPAAGPHKPIPKSGMSTITPSKGKNLFGSPSSSQPDKYGASASPFTSGNLMKGHDTVADIPTTHNISKTSISDKETRSRLPSSASGNKSKNSRGMDIKPSDLRSSIVSLLMENHSKGMSLQGLEKAIGNTMRCSARQIEPILKQIATLEAPGRYFLKQGLEMESLKKPPVESESLQTSHHKSPGSEMFDQVSARDAILSARTDVNDEEQAQLRSTPGHVSDEFEKVDILHNSPDRFSDKKVVNNSEGLQGSSSDSGSDSDSESDGSDSSSDSKNKSSSDSESDASSSSKQASDEDVDIMLSDDDKESKDKLRNSYPAPMKSPFQLSHPDSEFVDIGNYERQDEHISDTVDIERDSPLDNHEAARSTSNHLFPSQEGREPAEETKSYSSEYDENRERHAHDRKSHDGPDSGTHDSFKTGQPADHQRSSKSKSKRHSDEIPNSGKRFKSKNSRELVSGTISMLFGETTNTSSPDEPLQQPSIGTDQITGNFPLNDNNDHSSAAGINEGIPAEPHQPVQRSFEASGRPEALSRGTKSGKHDSSGRGVKNSEINIQSNEYGLSVERNMTRLSADGIGDKHATYSESHNKKLELQVKSNVADPRHSGYFTKETNNAASDKSPVMNGRVRILQREHSDLELGEFREPNNDENSGSKKQFERKGSFRQLDNRPADSSDSSRKRPSNKINADSRKLSTPNSEAVAYGIRDGPSKKKVPDNYAGDHTRIQNRHAPSLTQQQQSSGVHTEVASESNKSRYGESGKDHEARMNTYRKVPNNAADQRHDPIQGVVPPSTKESKKQMTGKVSDSHRRKDVPLTGSIDGGPRGRESSSDENSCSYTKYEKEEPELKGPIRNASQYREYVKEYQEKYESYCSLNKVLEAYRDEFSNLGKDLETYRERDMKKYHDILGQIKSSFHQCGERHKRLKKIFVVLYEELKHLKQMIKDYAAAYTKDGGS